MAKLVAISYLANVPLAFPRLMPLARHCCCWSCQTVLKFLLPKILVIKVLMSLLVRNSTLDSIIFAIVMELVKCCSSSSVSPKI